MDDFIKDLEANKNQRNTPRADFFKLKNGDNRIVIMTNPVGYSEVFRIGIAYENCGYGKFAGRRYKCYVKDIEDGKIKMANFSYTVAMKLADLKNGARTKFDAFPMPYVLNLKTTNAGTKEVETSVLADEDYVVSIEDDIQLASFDPIREVLEHLKVAQKKKVESDTDLQKRIADLVAEEEKKAVEKAEKRKQDTEMQIRNPDSQEIEYPEAEIQLDDIPF